MEATNCSRCPAGQGVECVNDVITHLDIWTAGLLLGFLVALAIALHRRRSESVVYVMADYKTASTSECGRLWVS